MNAMQDMYISFGDSIKGESKDAKHQGWIDVLCWEYGVFQQSSMPTGGGGGAGKAHFGEFRFQHYWDRASPNLMKYCASLKPIKTVTLSCCKAGDGSQEYGRVVLSDCIITNVTPMGSQNSPLCREEVAISYSHIKVAIKEQNANGSLGAEVTGTWNVKENKEDK